MYKYYIYSIRTIMAARIGREVVVAVGRVPTGRVAVVGRVLD